MEWRSGRPDVEVARGPGLLAVAGQNTRDRHEAERVKEAFPEAAAELVR